MVIIKNQLNSNLGGLSFYEDADGNKYTVGADSVPKKLGSPTPDMYLWTSSPVDIKALMPDIYDKMTTADFLVGSTGSASNWSANQGSGHSHAGSCACSYNAQSGVLTFGGYNLDWQYNQYRKIWHTHQSTGMVFAVYKGTIGGTMQ